MRIAIPTLHRHKSARESARLQVTFLLCHQGLFSAARSEPVVLKKSKCTVEDFCNGTALRSYR